MLNTTRLTAQLLFGVSTAGCGASPTTIAEPQNDRQIPYESLENNVTGERVSIHQQFRTLDDYLRYLERQSQMDGAWYKEIQPGIYELQTGNLHLDTPSGEQRIFTREELARKFGFQN